MNYNKIKFRRYIARHLQPIVRFLVKTQLKLINFEKNPAIIILTIGKVGSSSVYYSLKKQFKGNVFHLHNFTKESIQQAKTQHLYSDRKSLPLHLIVAEELLNILNKKKVKYYVITLTRASIGRIVSSFFQNTEMYAEQLEDKNIHINEDVSLSLLNNIFADTGIENQEEVWFDEQIKKGFSIDVFKSEFDINKGYNIYNSEKADLLLIRMEDLDRVFTNATKEFFSKKNGYSLLKHNVGDHKHYSKVYKLVKKRFFLTKEQIGLFKSSKFIKIFYPNLKDNYYTKWMKE